MLKNLISFFTGATPASDALPEADAKLALGALLVRVARADEHYVFEEISTIDRILADRYDLNAVEAAKMRATAEKLEAATPDTPEFARLIREGVPYDERRAIVEALWSVSEADGVQDAEEASILHLIEVLLGVETADSDALRAAARTLSAEREEADDAE